MNWNNESKAAIRIYLALALAIALVTLAFPQTLSEMVAIWAGSETYNHCFLVIPAFVYFVWLKRTTLSQTPAPNFLGAIPLASSGFLWLLGAFADVNLVQQFAFIAMTVSLTAGFLGWKASKEILFPLLFLFLAVPVGEELLPVMMDFTANFTVSTLRLMGYPVFREGNHFSMPTGNWSVVEACSGVRYLIASVTMGLIYAYITYTSIMRRTVFMLAAVIVPIIANGLRAVIIVLLGHYSGMTIATGVDHLIYGWLFFGVVIFILFWAGSFWRQDENGKNKVHSANETSTAQPMQRRAPVKTVSVIAALTVIPFLWPLWQQWSEGHLPPSLPELNFNVMGPYKDCHTCIPGFEPSFSNADAYIKKAYQSESGAKIYVYVAVYYSWTDQGELISYQNQLVLPGDSQRHIIQSGVIEEGESYSHITGKTRLRAHHWYQIDDNVFSNKVLGKVSEAKLKLAGRTYLSNFYAIYIETEDLMLAEYEIKEFLSVNRAGLRALGVMSSQ